MAHRKLPGVDVEQLEDGHLKLSKFGRMGRALAGNRAAPRARRA
jgi:hypothetical protein